MKKRILIFCLSLFVLKKSDAFWNFPNMQDLLHYLPFNQQDIIIKTTSHTKELKENCDENILLLQLARLYVTSPERIIILLSAKSINSTCQDITDVLQHINHTVSDSIPLSLDNLYMKLYIGLEYFNSYVCLYNPNTRGNHLINYHECLAELREDLYDCEGPPDWFEKSNEALVCQYYNEIINCNYIKTAMLCGLKPALMLRTFSDEIMKRIVTFKCKTSRSLPHIDDPMPARGVCHLKCYLNCLIYTYSLFQLYVYIHRLMHFPYRYICT